MISGAAQRHSNNRTETSLVRYYFLICATEKKDNYPLHISLILSNHVLTSILARVVRPG